MTIIYILVRWTEKRTKLSWPYIHTINNYGKTATMKPMVEDRKRWNIDFIWKKKCRELRRKCMNRIAFYFTMFWGTVWVEPQRMTDLFHVWADEEQNLIGIREVKKNSRWSYRTSNFADVDLTKCAIWSRLLSFLRKLRPTRVNVEEEVGRVLLEKGIVVSRAVLCVLWWTDKSHFWSIEVY